MQPECGSVIISLTMVYRPPGSDVRNAVTQGVIGKTLTFRFEVAFFLMEERLPIGDEILKVADLWVIHGRVIDFRDDTVPQGEPDSARSRVSGSHSVFISVSPSRLDARPSESWIAMFWFHLAFPLGDQRYASPGTSFCRFLSFVCDWLGIVPAAITSNDTVSLNRTPGIRIVFMDWRRVSQNWIDNAPGGFHAGFTNE